MYSEEEQILLMTCGGIIGRTIVDDSLKCGIKVK